MRSKFANTYIEERPGYFTIHHDPWKPTNFFDHYKSHTGISYLADKENILKAMAPRLKTILKLEKMSSSPEKKPILYDFGCSYGHFFSLAKDYFDCAGYDKDSIALSYAKNTYNLYPFCPSHVDIITAWFVFEHLNEENACYFLYNYRTVLREGGLLCLSMPNPAGGFFRFKREAFEATDDPSHLCLYTPKAMKKLLSFYHFKTVKIVITGHHPERWFPKKLLPLGMLLSKLFSLGDTYEIYARRVK